MNIEYEYQYMNIRLKQAESVSIEYCHNVYPAK